MSKLIDLTGQKFGRLTVIKRAENKRGQTRWETLCECGKVCFQTSNALSSGHSKSCGCAKIEALTKRLTTHGQSVIGYRSKEYGIWSGIKTRCYNTTRRDYKYYGGRGIIMCEEWRNSFIAFYAYVGKCPDNMHSIDRINNDGNYEPGNVRWATKNIQFHNTRKCKLDRDMVIEIRNSTMSTKQLMEVYGVGKDAINDAKSYRTWREE
jgi:hypothetical protein